MACPFRGNSGDVDYNANLFCTAPSNPQCKRYNGGVDANRCGSGKDSAVHTYNDCPFYMMEMAKLKK